MATIAVNPKNSASSAHASTFIEMPALIARTSGMFRRFDPHPHGEGERNERGSNQERVDGYCQRRAGHDSDGPPRRRCGGIDDGRHGNSEEQGVDEGTLGR